MIFADGTVSKRLERRLKQPPVLLGCHFRPALTSVLGEQFLGDIAECVAPGSSSDLPKPTLQARIGAVGDQFAVRIASIARFDLCKYSSAIAPERGLLPATSAVSLSCFF